MISIFLEQVLEICANPATLRFGANLRATAYGFHLGLHEDHEDF